MPDETRPNYAEQLTIDWRRRACGGGGGGGSVQEVPECILCITK